jgi:ATP-dependent RNA helicase DeaD
MNNAQPNGSFEALGLNPSILKALDKMGFAEPTPIQNMVIPSLLEGTDIIAQAQTGTGKTAAFGLPVLEMMSASGGATALVLTPTRELARQVCEQLNRFGEFIGIKSTAICGGESFGRQIEMIKKSRILVATPGRLLDLYRSNRLKSFNPSYLILDEADEMLDMGFLEDIETIVSYLPKQRQALLFSATMSKSIKSLAKKLLKDPLLVNLTKENTSHKQIEQKFYIVRHHERVDALIRLIDCETEQKSLIFCATKKDVDHLSEVLSGKGYTVAALHGDMAQPQRKRAVDAFRFGRCRLLIATDVAARGLDVSDITHVYNFEIPFSDDSYTHRIGRTGRAGKTGTAITFVTPKETRWLQKLSKINGGASKVDQIPSLGEVKRLKMQKIIDDLKNHPVDPDAASRLEELKQTMDLQEINASLMSLLLKNEKITGPDRIGLTADELKAEPRSFPKKRGKKFGSWKKPHRKGKPKAFAKSFR